MELLEWNIHQQGRNSEKIPMDIFNYINNEDIVVLLEINKKSQNIDEICKEFYNRGYEIYITDYNECVYANDILIAINSRNDIVVEKSSYYISYGKRTREKYYDCIPENIFIDVKINKNSYVLGAVRIKELKGNYTKRRMQMETLISWTNEMDKPVILIGDFNNLREDTKEKNWNLEVLDQIIKDKFIRKTPNDNHSWGVSYYPDTQQYDGYIKEDHVLISRSINRINNCRVRYCWDYINDHIHECNIDDKKDKYGKQKITIPLGIPDHALFKVYLPLE